MLTRLLDPVACRLAEFLKYHGANILAQTLAKAPDPDHWTISAEAPDDAALRLSAALKHLIAQVAALCQEHAVHRLLILLRLIPYEYAVEFLRVAREASPGGCDAVPLFTEAVLFATNAVVRWSQANNDCFSVAERYTFLATDAEMADATQLMTLALIHRHCVFQMNSIARRFLVKPGQAFERLLEIQNTRHSWIPKPKITQSDEMLVYPGLAISLPEGARTVTVCDGTGHAYQLCLSTFVPFPISPSSEVAGYLHVAESDFADYYGFSYKVWLQVWFGLNRLLFENLPILWSDGLSGLAGDDAFQTALEKVDDYSRTGLGSGSRASIVSLCYQILCRDSNGDAPSLEDCNAVIDSLIFSKFAVDVQFPEQPILFYEMGPDRLFWDYLRHPMLLRAVMRPMKDLPASSNVRGKFYERIISSDINRRLQNVQYISSNLKIRSAAGQAVVWEVDVAFAMSGILFIVECKNRQKSVRHYFDDGTAIADRDQELRGALRKQDRNLRIFAGPMRELFPDPTIVGAICLVCTPQPEFIPSLENEFWIQIPQCPRICMLSELIELLHTHATTIPSLRSHVAFVALPAP